VTAVSVLALAGALTPYVIGPKGPVPGIGESGVVASAPSVALTQRCPKRTQPMTLRVITRLEHDKRKEAQAPLDVESPTAGLILSFAPSPAEARANSKLFPAGLVTRRNVVVDTSAGTAAKNLPPRDKPILACLRA
jgi:hypothetical protein